MQSITERKPLVEGFYEKCREPALEPCMKIQRNTGVNGMIRECELYVFKYTPH